MARQERTQARKDPRWLQAVARNVTSRDGEDGIIEKALEVIGETDGWCVEFGACYGVSLSNTRELWDKKG